jgi:CheY-like chemotaxis protein
MQQNVTERSVRTGHVLVVDDDPMTLALVREALEAGGHTVETAESGRDALHSLGRNLPDLVIADVAMPAVDGFELLTQLRSQPSTQALPVMFLTSRVGPDDAVHALRLGADDYVRKPVPVPELVARVEAKLGRPPVPVNHLHRHPGTGLLTEARLHEELAREVERWSRSGRPGCVAALDLAERHSLRERLGSRADQDLRVQVAVLATAGAENLDLIGQDADGRLLVLMPETSREQARERLLRLSEHVAKGSFTAAGERVHVTAVVGFAPFSGETSGGTCDSRVFLDRAVVAADAATAHLDLQPVEWTPEFEAAKRPPPLLSWPAAVRERLRAPVQVALTLGLGVVLPFIAYVMLDLAGINLAGAMYVVVVGLLVTATLIWVEGFLALDPERPPEEPATPYPPASAVIAAYLPNEAATVLETVEAFLRVDYPGRDRRFFSWLGGMTSTVSSACNSASTTGPSGRSMPTSATPAASSWRTSDLRRRRRDGR